MSLTLREIIDHHAADFGSYSSKQQENISYLRFFMPVVDVTEPEATRSLTILPESRPEFYDFDLFGDVQQVPELEDRPLTDLAFTVFDMETTGLNPALGNENQRPGRRPCNKHRRAGVGSHQPQHGPLTYHRRRRQTALGRLTPIDYETIMTPPALRAA